MRDFNAWADKLPRHYSTRANAERAAAPTLANMQDEAWGGMADRAGVLYHHRADGRWSVVMLNPPTEWIAALARGPWGVWS